VQAYYLAIDIGASSGRHILGSIKEGNLSLEEIYRFDNGMERRDGQLCWNTEHLFSHILEGLKKCRELNKIPVSLGIDTWGVDFVLLDKDGNRIGNAVGYRDDRTEHMDLEVNRVIPAEELYQRTGIQKQSYNTIYQLMAVKKTYPEELKQSDCMLMTPDYYHYLLTGIKKQEYTIATTGQLVNIKTMDWDYELLDRLELPRSMFQPINKPGTVVGYLKEEVRQLVGFNCKVIMPASHDTASAVVAVPSSREDIIYISSGTWSLIGIELEEPNNSLNSMRANFTNEGGYDYQYRYLKNIMGLWMIQSVKKEVGDGFSFDEICKMASKENIPSLVDCNDNSFLAPASMVEAVQAYCSKTRQQIPESLGEIAAVIYQSLAKCYADAVSEIEHLTGKKYQCIHIIGGGSKADYLNQLTAMNTSRKVFAGPSEATAIGNIMVQMLKQGEISSLQEGREYVAASFPLKEY
jgi:rhamnulokinase